MPDELLELELFLATEMEGDSDWLENSIESVMRDKVAKGELIDFMHRSVVCYHEILMITSILNKENTSIMDVINESDTAIGLCWSLYRSMIFCVQSKMPVMNLMIKFIQDRTAAGWNMIIGLPIFTSFIQWHIGFMKIDVLSCKVERR